MTESQSWHATGQSVRVINVTRETVLAERVQVARSVPARLIGLLGRDRLAAGEGMLLEETWLIHTCFMRFPIDVLFLNGSFVVVHIAHKLRPFRVSGSLRANAALELPAGSASSVSVLIADRLEFTPVASHG